MFCKKCGAENPNNAMFCKKCGFRFAEIQRVPAKMSAGVQMNAQQTNARKRKPAFTTQKTNAAYLGGQLISDIFFLGLSVFFFIRGNKLIDSYWHRSDGEAVLQLAGAIFLVGFLSLIYHIMVSRTYADCFDNRITGSGMQGIQTKSFSLRIDQIVGVSVSHGFLNLEAPGKAAFVIINTIAGTYKVITTNERANEIAEYYSRMTLRHNTERG